MLEPVQEGVVALPQAEANIPWVDVDDIAVVVVKAKLKIVEHEFLTEEEIQKII